jgi:hypothetical protein
MGAGERGGKGKEEEGGDGDMPAISLDDDVKG